MAVPPAGVRTADAAAGSAERRRWRGRDADKFGDGARRSGDEPVRGRVLPRVGDGAAGGGVGLRRNIRKRGVSGLHG